MERLIRIALLAVIAWPVGAPIVAAQSGSFAGTWRGVEGDEGIDIRSIRIEIEERQGKHRFVRAVSSDPRSAADAEGMSAYFGGDLLSKGPDTLQCRRVMERISMGDDTVDVIGVATMHLEPGGARLRLDVEIFPEGFEAGTIRASWSFERVGPVSGTAAGDGGQGEFTVQRPTFLDALKVPATGQEAVSTRALEAGAAYRIRVEGSVALAAAVAGKWVVADGAFIYHAERASSYFGRTPARADVLYIDDLAFDPVQGFTTTHIYTMDIQGTGRPLSAVVVDPFPEDNSGSLDVRIYRLHPDVLQADRPSSIDPALESIDRLIDSGRIQEALTVLRDEAARGADVPRRERLYQLIGVLEFVASRPLDPEELQQGVVMDDANLIGRAVRFDRSWASALNNIAIWQAWNGNIAVQEGNALSLLEEARRIAPDNPVVRANLARLAAEAGAIRSDRRR